MAAMDYKTAQNLADKIIQAGRGKGQPRELIIGQIIRESQAAGGAPQGAIANVLAPAPLEVSPATPAPMQPGIPLVAPKPTAPAPAPPQAEAMPEPAPRPAVAAPRPSRYRPMLEAAKARLVEMQTGMSGAAANKQPVSMADKVRFDTQKEVVRELEQSALAEEGAAAPEEMLAALAKREERLGRREELLQESKSRSPWEALLAGGAAMAQGRRGENFGEALSRGLQAGLTDYGRSRRENAAGVEEIGEARDETALKRYELGEKARADAVNLIDRQNVMEQRAITMRDNLLKSGVSAATADATVKTALANATKAQTEADYAGRVAESGLAVDRARINQANRLDEPKVNVELRADRDVLDRLAADYEAKRSLFNESLSASGMKLSLVPPELRADLTAAEARLRTQSSAFERIHGKSPYITMQRKGGTQGGNKPPAPTGKGWSATKF